MSLFSSSIRFASLSSVSPLLSASPLFLNSGSYDPNLPCRRELEESLRQEVAAREAPDGFAVMERLQTLYSRHMKSGGMQGLHWLTAVRTAFEETIRAEHLYGQFLSEKDGRSVLDLPLGLKSPPALRLAEDMTVASIIHLPHQKLSTAGAMAYFRIEDLILGQDILSSGKLAVFRDLLTSLAGFSSIVVARDLHGRGHHLHDGHHRSHSALHTGHRYILAKMNREPKIGRGHRTWATMETLSPEDFKARIGPDASMAFHNAPLTVEDSL